MGARKKNMADAMKEARKTQSFAKLNNCPTSPRKMRLGCRHDSRTGSFKALFMLQHSPKGSCNQGDSKNCSSRPLPTGKPKTKEKAGRQQLVCKQCHGRQRKSIEKIASCATGKRTQDKKEI